MREEGGGGGGEGGGNAVIRPLPGRVVIRERLSRSDVLWTPNADANHVSTHIGTVLAKGPPALVCATDAQGRCESPTCKHGGVPHGFEVGAVVQYHFVHNNPNPQ